MDHYVKRRKLDPAVLEAVSAAGAAATGTESVPGDGGERGDSDGRGQGTGGSGGSSGAGRNAGSDAASRGDAGQTTDCRADCRAEVDSGHRGSGAPGTDGGGR